MLCGLTQGIFRLCGARTHAHVCVLTHVYVHCVGEEQNSTDLLLNPHSHTPCVCVAVGKLLVLGFTAGKDARPGSRKDWTRKAVTGLLLL